MRNVFLCFVLVLSVSCGQSKHPCSADMSRDARNCGKCDNVCSAGLDCIDSVCQCANGLTLCSATCIDTSQNEQNCGACGNVCGLGQYCQNGKCIQSPCDVGVPCNGVCTDITKDNQHCGACDNAACLAVQNCQSSQCVCPNHQTLCSTACVDVNLDEHNCGTCGNVCNDGWPCTNGTCIKPPTQICQIKGDACSTWSSDWRDYSSDCNNVKAGLKTGICSWSDHTFFGGDCNRTSSDDPCVGLSVSDCTGACQLVNS